MPQTTISTPEHTAAITRTTLGITSTRDTAPPSWAGGIMYNGFANCAVSEDA